MKAIIPYNNKIFHINIDFNKLLNQKAIVNFIILLMFLVSSDNYNKDTQTLVKQEPIIEDVVQYVSTIEDNNNIKSITQNTSTIDTNIVSTFLTVKHTLISKYLIANQAKRLDDLKDQALLNLNREITISFIEVVLKNKAKNNVYKYFTDNTDLNKIETALMEQAKYNVPASIKLAQSALETGYGSRIVENNYFGIKSKKGKLKAITTTEYYTAEEYKANKNIIISTKQITKNGQILYKCLVKDYFAGYDSPWHSFREHSIFLSTNKRYAPLFAEGGKNYEDWAEKIGSTKYGGVGYATSPIYGQILKQIIENYHLDLLDY